MPVYTNRLGLYKPDRADPIAVDTSLAENFQRIDDLLGDALITPEQTFTSLGERLLSLRSGKSATFGTSVKEFGAFGDGEVNDTQAFLDAVAHIESLGGGVLYIPAGEYVIDGRIELTSNITVFGEEGTLLVKNPTRTSAHIFVIGLAKGTTGYGGGARNVNFFNLTFRGTANTTTRVALANTFNHAENVIFSNCKFIDCITQDHALDLAGCSNILIEDCDFIGAYNTAGREYTECIQIDSSTSMALGDPAFTNTDNLPTKGVTVRRCQFLPSYNANGTVKNYAPNPIGNHGFTGGMYYDDIVFEDNYVKDGWTSTGGNWRAWIHFYALRNARFSNNHFVNTQSGLVAGVLGFYTSSGGRYNPTTGASETGVPMPCARIVIEGNTFTGFRQSEDSSPLIRAYGEDYNGTTYRTADIEVLNNKFYGAGSLGAEGSGGNLIQISKYIGVKIIGNKADLGGRLCYVYTGLDAKIFDNNADRMSQGVVMVTGSDLVFVKGNTGADVRRPLELTEVKKGYAKDNFFDVVRQTAAEDYACKLRNIERFQVQSNFVTNQGGMVKGFYIYQTSAGAVDQVNAYDNMAVGFSQDVFTSGTLTNYRYRA